MLLLWISTVIKEYEWDTFLYKYFTSGNLRVNMLIYLRNRIVNRCGSAQLKLYNSLSAKWTRLTIVCSSLLCVCATGWHAGNATDIVTTILTSVS